MKDPDPDYPLRFGASGLAAMYSSDAADFLLVLRKSNCSPRAFSITSTTRSSKCDMKSSHSPTSFASAPIFGPVILLLSACAAVGPDYSAPVIQTPDAWTENVAQQLDAAPQSTLQTWWKVFNDPVLDDLIERCRADNLDLQIAISRVRESRAALAISSGAKLPVMNAAASSEISKLSDDGPLKQVAPAGGFDSQQLYEIGVDATWEIDVFGRIRRSIEAAGADYQATIEDYRDVLVDALCRGGFGLR